jgi:SAM-dependent methyltransferase
MSFSFNFVVNEDGDDENAIQIGTTTTTTEEEEEECIQLRPAKQHILSQEHISKLQSTILSQSKIDTISFGEIELKKVTLQDNSFSSIDCEFVNDLKKTDLISGLYEGGFKLWECSIDVIRYLMQQQSNSSSGIDLKNKRVLECGCGHGLPGLYSIEKGATVDFQDYNWEVIEYLTMANVLLCNQQTMDSQFYSGDWKSLIELIPAQSYDLIVTSDTLYHTHSHDKLYKFMKHVLKPDGEILVAAKRYYFGCGGSVHSFKQLVEQDDAMTVTSVSEVSDGHSNVREILSLKFK